MPSYLSPTGEAIMAKVRALGPVIDEAAPEIDRIRDLPAALADTLRAQDLFRLVQPRDYGGIELDPPSLMQVVEEVAKHDASTAWCLGQTNICAYVAGFLPPETVRTIFGPRSGIVAWGPGPAQARVVPGGYRLTGKFDFASGSRLATWLGAHVPVIEADGSRRVGPDGKPTITTLLFPKENAEVRDTWQVIGLRGTGSDSYTVTDLFVPEAYSLHRHPSVRPRVGGKLYVFTQSTLYAPSFAGIAFGIARAFMDAFVRDMKDTTPRGASRSRGENHVMQARVGESEARLRSARTYLLSEVAEIWAEAQDQDVLTPDQLMRIRMASTWGIQSARQVVADLYAAAGALAIFDIHPFERRFRDIHTLSQQIQSRDVHFEAVGRVLFNGDPEGVFL